MPAFFGHEELAAIRNLRTQRRLDQAEELLMGAEPSPAVLDELRKIASTRARKSRKTGDWQAVVEHLERYDAYAEKCREYCMATVNQAPPPHTKTDRALLQEARHRLSQGPRSQS